jgi:hypothetical protein
MYKTDIRFSAVCNMVLSSLIYIAIVIIVIIIIVVLLRFLFGVLFVAPIFMENQIGILSTTISLIQIT